MSQGKKHSPKPSYMGVGKQVFEFEFAPGKNFNGVQAMEDFSKSNTRQFDAYQIMEGVNDADRYAPWFIEGATYKGVVYQVDEYYLPKHKVCTSTYNLLKFGQQRNAIFGGIVGLIEALKSIGADSLLEAFKKQQLPAWKNSFRLISLDAYEVPHQASENVGSKTACLYLLKEAGAKKGITMTEDYYSDTFSSGDFVLFFYPVKK